MKKRRKRKKNKLWREEIWPWLLISLLFIGTVGATAALHKILRQENAEIYDMAVQKHLITERRARNAWLEFDFSNGKKRLFVGEFYEPYALAKLLTSATDEKRVRVSIKRGRIEKVDGVAGLWRLYRNDSYIGLSVNNLMVKPGDRYKIKLNK